MRKLCLTAVAASLIAVTGCGNADSADYSGFETDRTFFAMDTAVSFKGSADDAQKAEEIFLELDGLFDRYSETSDVYALNQRKNTDVSGYTREIINSVCALSEKYGSDVSIFSGSITDCWNINSENPTVPSDEAVAEALDSMRNTSFSIETMSFADENGSIDLGSVGKGYALDKIYGELGGESCYIVSANSSILLSGQKPDGREFTVSLRDPESGDGMLGTIKTGACFISTSGGYERFFEADGVRYSHIFDLSTGRPSETDLTSVTVICDSGIESDFLSTMIYTCGTQRLGEFLGNDSIKVIAVTTDREIYISGGIEFELNANSNYTIKTVNNE